jgi:Putative addiction module component
MNAIQTRLRSEVRSLPESERQTLIAALHFDLSQDFPDENEDSTSDVDEVDEAWDAEITSRMEEVISGKVKLLSREEFMSVFDDANLEAARRLQRQGSS